MLYLGIYFGVGVMLCMLINCGGEEWDIEDCSFYINVLICLFVGVYCFINGIFI